MKGKSFIRSIADISVFSLIGIWEKEWAETVVAPSLMIGDIICC